jgi:hypothetical protein
MIPYSEVNGKNADGGQSPIETHRGSDSPRSSWLTRKIFESFIPYAEAKERTVEDATKAFSDKNQTFLKTRFSASPR